MTRRALHIALPLVVAALTGCDDQETTRPDTELIVGTWLGETVDVRTVVPGLSLSVLDLEDGGDEARFTFEADGDYAFLFDPADGRTLDVSVPQVGSISIPLDQTVSFSGNYTLDEADGTIFLSAGSLPAGLTLEYEFDGDDRLEVIIDDPETLALLVGAATDDATIQLLASVVTGGAITYARN